MAERKKLGEAELSALISREIALADHSRESRSEKQTRALEYYQGTMKDVVAETGRSKAISRDVADVIGWVLPGIIRVFTASEHMAVAEPVGPEDEEGARQATDGLNHVFWKDNDGYRTIYNATWDSLLASNGVVKVYHDETPKTEVSVHTGLTDDAFLMLTGQADTPEDKIEVLEHTPSSPMVPDEQGGFLPDPLRTHDVKIRRTTKYGKTCVEAIPPEDYGKDDDSITCDEARFQYHRSSKTRSDLIKMGFDRVKVEGLNRSADDETTVDSARDNGPDADDDGDKSMELVDLYECYVRVDIDGDGIAELLQVFYGGGGKEGGTVLDWSEWDDEIPFNDIPCSPMPHRWEAMSLADETMDVQRIKTALLRQALDNTYATNNPQRFVEGELVNPDELFSPSFGGVVFGKPGSSVTPLAIPFVANHAYDAINYQDQVIERRTGVSRTTMALDPEALQNQTATANQNARDAAYSQIELIARNQAELGWKPVFRKILRLEVRHQNKPRIIRMRGRYIEIDPRHWNADMDVSINVGLGTGSRDRDMAMLQSILQDQLLLIQQFAQVGMVDKALEMLKYVKATLFAKAESAGIKSPELFYPEFGDQEIEQMKQQMQAKQGQPDPKVQLEQKKLEMQQQSDQAKLQMDQQKAQSEAQLAQQRGEIDMALAREKMQGELQIKREQLQAEMQLKREQLAAEMQLKMQLSEAEMQMKRDVGFYNADSRAASSGVHLGGAPG